MTRKEERQSCFLWLHKWGKWNHDGNITDLIQGRPVGHKEIYKRECGRCGLIQLRRIKR